MFDAILLVVFLRAWGNEKKKRCSASGVFSECMHPDLNATDNSQLDDKCFFWFKKKERENIIKLFINTQNDVNFPPGCRIRKCSGGGSCVYSCSPCSSPPPPNCSVIATVRGWFTSDGGRLESVETGVALLIPPGALPPKSYQLVYFKVCREDNYSIIPGHPVDKSKGTFMAFHFLLAILF